MVIKKKELTIIPVLGWVEIEKYDLLHFPVKITVNHYLMPSIKQRVHVLKKNPCLPCALIIRNR